MKTGKISKIDNTYVLYDADIVAEPVQQLFDGNYHTNQETQQNNSISESTSADKSDGDTRGIGRAQVDYFSYNGTPLVLKHYFRGGAVASLSKDSYLGFSIIKSRSFKEWRLLNKMHHLGLPVPRPVAARVTKSLFSYTADLITEEIKEARTLADILSEKPIDAHQWRRIGACIRLFHDHDVYHADLNARNILFAGGRPGAGDVYLIDFDNSGFRSGADSWKRANLARLNRSLLKFKRNSPGFNFEDSDWQALLAGYKRDIAE